MRGVRGPSWVKGTEDIHAWGMDSTENKFVPMKLLCNLLTVLKWDYHDSSISVSDSLY